MPRLIIFDSSVRGVDLPRQPLIIGRSKRSDIPIHDRLLSRKHCAVIPIGSTFKIVDLKSSHGTYLNGSRVERQQLAFDDVIEIGNTVMVYLDSDAWNRGEGLAVLRNPVKAQELVQRLKLHERRERRIPVGSPSGRRRDGESRKGIIDMLPVLMDPEDEEGSSRLELVELLTDYALWKTVSVWVRRQPELRKLLTKSIESALLASRPGSWEDLRGELRVAIERGLAELPGERESARPGGGDGDGS